MSDEQWPRLSAAGYELVFAINDAEGEDAVTPDDVADALEEAEQRITGGPCKGCGVVGDGRYGWCFDCVTKAEAEAEAEDVR